MSGLKTAFKWCAIGIGGVIGFIILLLLGLGLASEVGVVPATVVQTGEEMPEKQLRDLQKTKILKPEETVQYYYSEGMFKITDGGTIMSNERIIVYSNYENRLDVYAYRLNNLDYLVQTVEGTALDYPQYSIGQRGDDGTLMLFLSDAEDRHLEMISALETQIAKNEKDWAAAPN